MFWTLPYWSIWYVITLIYISVSDTENPLKTSHQNTIETGQTPSLSTTQSDISDIHKELSFTSGTHVPQSNGISTTRDPSDVTVLNTNNFSPTFDAKFLYPTSRLYDNPTVQQDEQASSDSGSATALPIIRKGNRTNNKIVGNESKNNQVMPPVRSPVYPTLPSSTHVQHDISEILHQNETESEYTI